jgi:succinyl-diaminopimelate desuccinylase
MVIFSIGWSVRATVRGTLTPVFEALEPTVVETYARELVMRPSINPPGDCTAPAAWVRETMEEIGLEVTVVSASPERPNVIGRLRGNGNGNGESLCLTAHTDVVGIGSRERWRHDPFGGEVVDGVLYGRGSADSKGQLAAMLAAAAAIKESAGSLDADLYVVAPVDDETAGSLGLRYVFEQGAVSAPYAIYGEATNFKVKRIYKSRLWFDLDVVGKSAHGAFPERGINAIDKAFAVIEAIRGMDLRNDPIVGADSVNVGLIRGGDQVNKVCADCRVSFDVRWGPGRSSSEVVDAVAAALGQARARDPQLEVGEPHITERREPLVFDSSSRLVAAALAAGNELLGEDVGDDPGWLSSGDLYWLWGGGHIKSGIVWGPGDPGQAHVVDEHIAVDDLVTGAKLYALAAIQICGAS